MPAQLPRPLQQIVWLGSSLDDLKQFPFEVRREVGFALRAAQDGGKSPAAKPLTGDKAFKGAVALEIVENHDGNTFRAVYTAKFKDVIFVLHAFQKKSKGGIATPQRDIDLIKRRLALAKTHHASNFQERDADDAEP